MIRIMTMGKLRTADEREGESHMVCVRFDKEILRYLDSRIDRLKDEYPTITRSDVLRAIVLRAKREEEGGGKKSKRSKK